MANSDEYKSRVGLKDLYAALVTADTAAGYTAGTPAYLAPAAEGSQEPVTSFGIQYADDQPFDVMTSEAETKIALKVTNIDPATLALITGKVFDAASGRMWDGGGTAPYMALSFRSLKSNGKYRYYQYLKGKFDMPKEAAQTLGSQPTPQPLDLTYTAIRTVYKFDLGTPADDTIKRVIGDEDTTNFSGTSWFSQVQTPVAVTPSALAMSPADPTSGATAVAVTKICTLTFNNALAAGEEFDCMLINSATGAVIAGVNTIDATRKIVTVAHTANLAAATLHRMIYTVKDVYGQTLAGTTSFTTA